MSALQTGDARPLIGVIRWDAWDNSGAPGKAMELSLGPQRYHYRLPFFGKIVSENEVSIGGYTQAVVDREIAFAKAGGIDYWAFLLYEPDTSMSRALSFYLSSAKKRDIRFCAIATPNSFGNADTFHDKMQRVISLMAEPSYQKTACNRPLLYLFDVSDAWIEAWGGQDGANRLFDEFRAGVKAKGMNTPYIVVMDFVPSHAKKVADIIHAEAVSSYAVSGSGTNGQPYVSLTDTAKSFWESCAATGAQVVPIVMAGWDRRPRIEHPVPWETWQKPGEGMDKYYLMPTPQELAAHIQDAMRWVAAKGDLCPAQTVIAYAWNEHDEGGWLCPTLNPDGTANKERLDAIAKMTRNYK